jgi:hypothetical protein
MADENADQRWIGLAVGLGVAGVISLLGLIFYLVRRSTMREGPIYVGGGGQPPPMYLPSSSSVRFQPTDIRFNTADDSMLAQQPMMHTYALTPLSDPTAEPVRMAQASNTAYDVILSVVGPTGAYAAFAMEPGELVNGGLFPTGNTIILPTCESRRIRLLPGQAIFAKGQPQNPSETVYATATAHEAGQRIYS